MRQRTGKGLMKNAFPPCPQEAISWLQRYTVTLLLKKNWEWRLQQSTLKFHSTWKWQMLWPSCLFFPFYFQISKKQSNKRWSVTPVPSLLPIFFFICVPSWDNLIHIHSSFAYGCSSISQSSLQLLCSCLSQCPYVQLSSGHNYN